MASRSLAATAIGVLLLAAVPDVRAQDDCTPLIPDIRAVGVDSIVTLVTVYHSDGYDSDAAELHGRLEGLDHVLRDSIGVGFGASSALVLLDEDDWNALVQRRPIVYPWGIPFGYCDVAVVPGVTTTGAAYIALRDYYYKASESWQDAVEAAADALGMTAEESLDWALRNVWSHEVGHVVVTAYLGERLTYARWLSETLANFVMLVKTRMFEADHFELQLTLFRALMDGSETPSNPSARYLQDHYETTLPTERGWFSSWYKLLAVELLDDYGFDFIRSLKPLFPWTGTFDALIDSVDVRAPGVRSWAMDVADYSLPARVALFQNYPNPFNPTTTISYSLPQVADVKLTVMDVLGRQIRELASGTLPAGTYEVQFDASGLPSGIYFYSLTAGDYTETRKMVLLR